MGPVKELSRSAQTFQNEAEFDLAMAEWIALITKPEPRSAVDEARLDELFPLIKAYEDEHSRIDTSDIDAIDMILFRIEQLGLTRKDLIPMIGSASRVSEVLNRKRPLTVKMIKKLHEGLQMPYEQLFEGS